MNEQKFSPEFDQILAECLDDVLRGRKTISECLAQHPQHAQELKPLLQAGLLTSRLSSPEMRPEAVERVGQQLRESASVRLVSTKRRLPLGLSRLAAVVLVALLLAFGGGGGLVAASANTVPGDTLYSVKRLWEALMLALAQLLGQGNDARAQLARTRLFEVEALDAQGGLSQEALIELHRAIYELTLHHNADNQGAILAFMTQLRDTLSALKPAPAAQGVYDDLTSLAITSVQNGIPQVPSNALPDSVLQSTATFTPTISPTPEPSSTLTATMTPTSTIPPPSTETPTITLTPSITPTETPRIPATATRTPSPTPSPTLSATPSPTPTATWTRIPLPGQTPIGGISTTQPPERIPSDTPIPLPSYAATERVRETQQSVYMTQTAEVEQQGTPTPGG